MITFSSHPDPKPLSMPWKRCIAMGRAGELLRGDAFAHLREVQRQIGFETCRFHGLFHDELAVVTRTKDGRIFYQWQQLDKVFDALLSIGLRPFVELGSMPAALASGTTSIFEWKMNVTPPRSWAEWGDLVRAFTAHMVDRYGLREVRGWFFEVWNEPNLSGFWTGTQAEYWLLYEHAALAVKSVDARLRVGGPATAHADWLPEFLAHCGGRGLPVDFLSTHSYPQDEFVQYPRGEGPSRKGDFLRDVYWRVRDEVAAIRPGLEIHWSEWNPLSAHPDGRVDWRSNPSVDNAYGGAFVARHCVEADGLCDSMAYWVASDIFEELGMPHAPFTGTYGLLNPQGIPKATFHAMKLAAQMEGDRLEIKDSSGFPNGCGLVATRTATALRVLLWNAPRPDDRDAATWKTTLALPSALLDFSPGDANLPVNAARRLLMIHTRIAAGSGSAYETWLALGSPQNLSLAEERLLRAHAEPAMGAEWLETSVDGADGVKIPVELPANQTLLLELRPGGEPGPVKGSGLANVLKWDAGMGEAAK